MIEPPYAAAALHPGLIRLSPAFDEQQTEAWDEPPPSRWREDLRFFVVCYTSALAAFLLILG